MLLRQKPVCDKFYIAIDDAELNDYLQAIGFVPKYYNNHIYYYKKNHLLEHLIDTCNKLRNRKEVSKFGNL